jgi:hypothetical protein
MRQTKSRLALWISASLVTAIALAGFVWVRVLHHGPPAALWKDIRAGAAARDIQDPDARLQRYLEERYGPMTDLNCRREAFLGFFDVDHIQALHLLLNYSPEPMRPRLIAAMARWVEAYRSSLTSRERMDLSARFTAPEGQAMLKRSTAAYNSQDVRYRGATAPVISQLLKTIREVQQTQ